MFESLPHHFREHNLSADVRTLLLLKKAMEKGLVNTLGDIYVVLKGLVTTNPEDFGPYTSAFYSYFLDIDIKKGEKLDNAILRSEAFKDWKEELLKEEDDLETPDIRALVDRFLDEIHLTTFDIQKIVDGSDILKKDDPDMPDTDAQGQSGGARNIDKAADYREISLSELLERMEKVARQQKGLHEGGDHWIGTGGRSPYGHGGAAMGGIRAGGGGGGKMARRVVGDPMYYPVDTKSILRDDNIDAALASLKGIEDETTELLLDIPRTITEGLKQGGIFLPYEKEKIDHKVQVILMIDNGGYSMHPYIKSVTKLFSKMKTRFAHDLKTYYFHNTIYGGAYTDVRRRDFVPVDKIIADADTYSVFIIGDADMAPYELDYSSLGNWQKIKKHFPRIAWMNPMQTRYWAGSTTIHTMRQIFSMYPLSPEGIEKAVIKMNRKRKYSKKG